MALHLLDTEEFIASVERVRVDKGADASVLLMFDVDGTLKSFTDVHKKEVGTWVDKLLAALCNAPGFDVYLNTGKSLDSLQRNYGGISNLGWYGEHGALYKAPDWSSGQISYLESEYKDWVTDTKTRIKQLGGTDRGCPGQGIMDPHKKSTITFTTKRSTQSFTDFAQDLMEKLPSSARVTFHSASGTLIEVTPTDVHKGTAVQHLHSVAGPYHLALAVGDDERDSDMFKAIKDTRIAQESFTVMITDQSSPQTEAEYRLSHYYRLLIMLQKLVPEFDEPLPV